jgi:D-3-phosphoglycerate dehydrogenase / 2-oxoglutarate reductase
MGPMRIVCTSPVPSVAQELFAPLGGIEVRNGAGRADLADVDVLVLRAGTVDPALLAEAPRLRIVARTGAGYDSVDLEAATAHGVAVLHAPDAGVGPVAEGAFALILAAAKRLRRLGDVLRRGEWDRRYAVGIADLDGAVLGVVGFGRIGQAVGLLGQAFGMHVLAHDPFLAAESLPDGAELVALPALVRSADVITLHCALTDATRGLIDRSLLAQAKPGAVLVNVARGPIVESGALLEALEAGWLSAVGLDVFEHEPPRPDDPLLSHPDVICTPHSVGLTTQWNARVFGSLAGDIERLAGGAAPRHIVNGEVLDDWRLGSRAAASPKDHTHERYGSE